MPKKIKPFIIVILTMFFVVSLSIAFLSIWDFINNEVAKKLFLKVCYTFIALFVVSLIVLFITNTPEDKK